MSFYAYDRDEIKRIAATAFPRKHLRYVVVDIVRFTKQPPDLLPQMVRMLEVVILAQTKEFGEGVIRLQAGDAICLVFEENLPEGVHWRTAFNIHYAMGALDVLEGQHRILLRMAVGEGHDYEFEDINGRRNFAGAGLNETFRACQCGKVGEIFGTATAFENLPQATDHFLSAIRSSCRSIDSSFSKAAKEKFTFYRMESVINWAKLKWPSRGKDS